jgi:hypothetical protein
MTPLYDSLVGTSAGGAPPAVPSHPDIYEQVCLEHGVAFDWPVQLAEVLASDAAHGVAGQDAAVRAEPGWFETGGDTSQSPSGDRVNWFAA